MRFMSVIASAMLVLLTVPRAAEGRDTIRIMVGGGSLRAPIVITDPAMTARFKVATGPGTFELLRDGTRTTNTAPSFIIDWNRGVADPPKGLTVYQVSFFSGRRDAGIYIVYYTMDSTRKGYVYIPGPGDPHYENNVRLLHRGNEGHWFYAWNSWEDVINPLITEAVSGH